MASTIDTVRKLIQSRLVELDAEARRLERASASLGEGDGPDSRRHAAPASNPGKPRTSRRLIGAKRAPRGQRREQLLAAIKASPGTRPAELAKAIGIKPAQVHALISKASAKKLIVKRGKGYALKS
jgi:hypothetical protein